MTSIIKLLQFHTQEAQLKHLLYIPQQPNDLHTQSLYFGNCCSKAYTETGSSQGSHTAPQKILEIPLGISRNVVR